MQPAPTHRPTLYEALEALPEGVVGEILNGRLHTQPRPAGPHVIAGSVLGAELLVLERLGVFIARDFIDIRRKARRNLPGGALPSRAFQTP